MSKFNEQRAIGNAQKCLLNIPNNEQCPMRIASATIPFFFPPNLCFYVSMW